MQAHIDNAITFIEKALEDAQSKDAVECLRLAIDAVNDARDYENKGKDDEGDKTYEQQHRQTKKDIL